MNREDAARYLGHTSSQTLATWQVQGKGPRSVKVGGRIFYFREDLDAFVRDGGQIFPRAHNFGGPAMLIGAIFKHDQSSNIFWHL